KALDTVRRGTRQANGAMRSTAQALWLRDKVRFISVRFLFSFLSCLIFFSLSHTRDKGWMWLRTRGLVLVLGESAESLQDEDRHKAPILVPASPCPYNIPSLHANETHTRHYYSI